MEPEEVGTFIQTLFQGDLGSWAGSILIVIIIWVLVWILDKVRKRI